jgi:hypothetical protein
MRIHIYNLPPPYKKVQWRHWLKPLGHTKYPVTRIFLNALYDDSISYDKDRVSRSHHNIKRFKYCPGFIKLHANQVRIIKY